MRSVSIFLFALGLLLSQGGTLEARAGYAIRSIASFSGEDGSDVRGSLAIDSQGNLYGTTFRGGADDDGSVFRIAAGSNVISSIASFDGADGHYPIGGPILDTQGNIFGSASGGIGDPGSIFRIAAGTAVISTIASFNYANGSAPGGITLDAQGNLYGTTIGGGIFKVAAGTNTISTIASFSSNGIAVRISALTLDAQGNLYGTTSGGTNGAGIIFKIASGTNTLTTLATFNSTNGAYPIGNLTIDANGNFFGVTSGGGDHGYGTVFKVDARTGTISTIASFDASNGSPNIAGVTLDSSGDLFGTIYSSLTGRSSVFEVAAGTDVISSLGDIGSGVAYGALVVDSRGNLYGTTQAGGPYGDGNVFEVVNNASVVPEPASLVLLGQVGLVSFGLVFRSRRHRG